METSPARSRRKNLIEKIEKNFMNKRTVSQTAINRQFLNPSFQLSDWPSLAPYLDNLCQRKLDKTTELERFMKDRSELESYLSENFAWRYIQMTCDTQNIEIKKHYEQFVTDIQPKLAEYDDILNNMTLASPALDQLSESGYAIAIKGMRQATEIFRSENISYFTELQQLSSQYQAAIGAMAVEINGKTLTLQQAGVYLESTDRSLRQEAYTKIQNRRLQDATHLEELFDRMLVLRQKIAKNAGFGNFRDYMFAAMKRFDYGPTDCFSFHDAVATAVVPMLQKAAEQRKTALNLDSLKPWDKAVDVAGRASLRPFEGGADLLDRSIKVFNRLDPFLGQCMQKMKELNRLDLESRIGKAPGGYNYPLEESGFPFIFMNASSLMRDVITLLHEGGHAVHSILTKDLPINYFRNFPSEVAELASMSMELLTMDFWDEYFDNQIDLKRAKIQHLEDIISTLPWVATIDKFQHWIYENPGHTAVDRQNAWLQIYETFTDSTTNWAGQEAYKAYMWHRQLHIFELPFYYIEYGIAQLGAIAVWKNYKQNAQKGLEAYLEALALGYTKTIKDIYTTAGIKFDFSAANISELMAFVQTELQHLKK
jgi:oligoendopeptidase F